MDSVLTQGFMGISSHPMNSSQNFLGLLGLCEVGNHPDPEVRLALLGRMLAAIRFRDDSIFFHSRRVTIIAVGISQRLGWTPDEIHHLELAALLHDFGKVGLPDHILQKPGRLNADERELIRTAHDVSEILLQASRFSETTLQIFRDSPSMAGDCGGSLGRHLGARILAVADAYDSLTHDQSHRRALTREQALEHLQHVEGAKFDRNVVCALERWLKSEDAILLEQAADVEQDLREYQPIDPIAMEQANSLCHLFSHLILLESLYDGYYLFDAEHRIVVWSRGAEGMFGKKRADVLGKPWSPEIANYSAKGLNGSVVSMAIDRLRPFMVSAQIKTGQGDLDVDVQAIPFWDQESRFRGACEIIHRKNASRRGTERYQELQMAATRDPLTGLANRKELERHLVKVFEDAQASGAVPFSAIFLDIDHFKSINDGYSHQTGDQVLVDVAHLVEDELYSGELVSRYGGEEFVVICPETTLADAYQRAERLRRAIISSEPAGLKVTASFGVAQLEGSEYADSVLQRADAAMFDAKRGGRNRTCQRTHQDDTQKSSSKVAKPDVSNEFELQDSFFSTVASNLIFHKLSGFVDSNRAKVWDVKADSFQMSVGESTLFGGWGTAPAKQPVQVFVQIGGVDRSRRTNRVEISIVIKPQGRKPELKAFHDRASRIRDEIRAYCVADSPVAT